jgi:hypothetical protein
MWKQVSRHLAKSTYPTTNKRLPCDTISKPPHLCRSNLLKAHFKRLASSEEPNIVLDMVEDQRNNNDLEKKFENVFNYQYFQIGDSLEESQNLPNNGEIVSQPFEDLSNVTEYAQQNNLRKGTIKVEPHSAIDISNNIFGNLESVEDFPNTIDWALPNGCLPNMVYVHNRDIIKNNNYP